MRCLNPTHDLGLSGMVACHTQSTERLLGLGRRPGPAAERPTCYVRARFAAAWSPRAIRARDGAMARLSAAQWRLAGGNVLG
jgi:hypothetical protein